MTHVIPSVTDSRGESFPRGRNRGGIGFGNTLQSSHDRAVAGLSFSRVSRVRESGSYDAQEAWGWGYTCSPVRLSPGC